MVTISKPLAASQAKRYHEREFSNSHENYYAQDELAHGQWHGRLAEEFGLRGAVSAEEFGRMAEGQHPQTLEQLVRHRARHKHENQQGELITSTEHRAGWDATFSAPKSVSLTALVGGDARVTAAHNASVKAALNEMERYVEARMGGNRPTQPTGKWAVAMFQHDTARPVEGYSAPQLHTHCVFFNVTQDEDGKSRALDPREIFQTQQLATSIYQAELTRQLRGLGYAVEAGKNGAPEIQGYTREYIEANSRRSAQIQEHMKQEGVAGAAAAQIAAHRTREAKFGSESREEVRASHLAMSERFGFQERAVIAKANEQQQQRSQSTEIENHAATAMTYARDRNLERDSVVDERTLLKDALRRAGGRATVDELRSEIDKRVGQGSLIALAPGKFTTREILKLEKANLALMKTGQDRCPAMASLGRIGGVPMSHLSAQQTAAVEQIFASRDRITGLEGRAGTGKTTTLSVVAEAARRAGYQVQGLAPTSRAAQQLAEAGLPCGTLQGHLMKKADATAGRSLYIVDEASLIGTKQMNELLTKLRPEDRLLLVGDSRQHEAVEGGRPFAQLTAAGMNRAKLDEIIRQTDVELRDAVQHLSEGEVQEAYEQLTKQGRVEEIGSEQDRIQRIAHDYSQAPAETLVVSPDNHSRVAINQAIREELRRASRLGSEDIELTTLTPRQDVTGADRQWAAQYQVGDVLRYSKGSKTNGIGKGGYAKVVEKDAAANTLTVELVGGDRVTYDPKRLQGVSIYQETKRRFSRLDRIQFTTPDKTLGVANREMATVQQIDQLGNMRLRTDAGRILNVPATGRLHLDHGYAVTSYSSQGLTSGRVLVHADAQSPKELVNARFAYVAASRGRTDVRIYTNDAQKLGTSMARDQSKRSALGELKKARDRYKPPVPVAKEPKEPHRDYARSR